MENFWQGSAIRDAHAGQDPGFTLVAVLTLALGIGANTAIFSVLDSVLLRSLPVPHPQELVVLTNPDEHGAHFGSQTGDRSMLAYSEFEYLRDHNQAFSHMFAADSSLPEPEATISWSPTGATPAKETVQVRLVTGDYFDTLGIKAAAGRTFTSEVDHARGASPIAVVSYAFWKRRFGLNPAVLGQTIQIHNTSFEIVGVASPGFFGETVGESPDMWVPMMMQASIHPGKDFLSASPGLVNQYMWLQVMGRLKPGISLAQANAAANVDFKNMLESNVGTLSGEERRSALDQRLNAQPGGRGASTLSEDFGRPLKLLMVLVGLVLLIACANVANLLLARGAARQKEFGMRLTMGAGRWRLIRQLLTETLLLALLGGAAGIVLAQWGDALLLRMVSGDSGSSTIQLSLQPDARMLAFTLGLTLLTAILFGLIPSLHVTRMNMSPLLKSTAMGGLGESGSRRLPVGKLLVVTQVAVSLILLIAAGLSVRSLGELSKVNLGYSRENLLLFRVDAAAGGFKTRRRFTCFNNCWKKSRLSPACAASPSLTTACSAIRNRAIRCPSKAIHRSRAKRWVHVSIISGPVISPRWEFPVLIGREIGPQDSTGTIRPAVVNQTFARRFFSGTNPIGKHIRDTYPGNVQDMEVVGVVADAKYNSLREKARPRVYAPLFNPLWDQTAAVYEVRTFADPASVSAALRQAVQETSASLPAVEISTMSGLVDESLQTDRFIERLSAAFGVLALVLASIGLYGIMAYTVARRTRDIGIRLALGAEPGNILRQVLRETLTLVLLGFVIGVPIAIGGTHFVRSMLFGLGIADPIAISFAALTLACVAVLAGFLPARRASRVDPMIALRYE